MRVCVFEVTNARALLKAEPPLPTSATSSHLDQAKSETTGASGRQQSCQGGGQGSCPQVQVTPPLVLLEPMGECDLAGLQPGAGGEQEASASVCVLSHTLTPHDSMCQLIV